MFNRIMKVFNTGGVFGLAKKFLGNARNQLIDQWGLIYLELPLDKVDLSLPVNEAFNLRFATRDDISKIKSDIYPVLDDYGEYDKQHIEKIGEKGIQCVIAEENDKVVHYFLVFDLALDAPIMRTPINKAVITANDASLGSQFTNPQARGKSISLYSLSAILKYLQTETNATRVLTIIHKDTPGAVPFHKRLGFTKIIDASPTGVLYKIKYLLFKIKNKVFN